METHARSIAKSLTWRVVALAITTTVALVVTGKIAVAASIGVADTLIKLGVYYMHERAWQRTSFGRAKTQDYEI